MPPSIPPRRNEPGAHAAPEQGPQPPRPPAAPPRRSTQGPHGGPSRPHITRQGPESPRRPLEHGQPPRTSSSRPHAQRAAHLRPPDGPPSQTLPGERLPSSRDVAPRKTRRFPWRRLRLVALALFAALVVAAVAANAWVEHRITTVDALSGAANTPGQTYLIVGSDSREGWMDDGTEGARTDTIMVMHQPVHGPTALISIPRDSYVEIPGHDPNKINAAFALGGPQLLVQTVEQLTGLTIDRYVEVGFMGVENVVNSLGGVELCYDADVNDPYSTLVWQAGCHQADGTTALAFSRMRYADPLGDIGRTQRQQQVVSAVAKKAVSPSVFLNPFKAKRVADAGLGSFRVSEGTHSIDLARMAKVFNAARGADAVTGTPPIASLDYRVDGVGSCVLLDPETIGEFWAQIGAGTYAPGTKVGGLA
ncbi:MAG: LytR family transcriptional regulator [Demequinaceae bacterium]|nr:LytR family transcriptional regulator [Demequinaceae bacterium]